jgi:hypothetical protein
MDTVLNITLKKGTTTVETPLNLPPLVSESFMFKGDEGNPFLAPRGVFLIKNHLFVTDTGQNRVFIWKNLSDFGFRISDFSDPSKHEIPNTKPDIVLGQMDKDDTGRNSGKKVSASTLHYPSGIWSDGEKLIVADAWNHRVLIWHSMPTENGQAADVVIGQLDFESNEPNVKGIGSNPTERSLNWCYGVFSDGERLWIADTGNRRVLFFNKIPTENYVAADGVIGKPNFNERDYDNADAIWPYSVKISPEGKMAITDTQYFRVLIWNDWQTAFTNSEGIPAAKADVIIGQPDFDSSGANQFGLYPQSHTLNWCYDTFFYEKGIFVVDTGNSRILWFENTPSVSNQKADNLIGKKDFNTGSENADTVFGTGKSLYWAFSICIDGDVIAIADTGNHRVFLKKLII